MEPNHTNKPKRDYRAEYASRIRRGIEKGLSRTQARGHPKAKEKSVRSPRLINDGDLQIGLKELRSGRTLAEAARTIRVSPERLRNQARALKAIKKRGRRWIVRTDIPRRMLVYSGGEAYSITVGKRQYASIVGRYMAAVGKFLRTNDLGNLAPFVGVSVTDIHGKTHLLETNPNLVYRLSQSGGESFEQVYRLVI